VCAFPDGQALACPSSILLREREEFFVKKTSTTAFANLVGAVLFMAVGIWAFIQMQGLQEVKDTYAQPSMFPTAMIVGLLIFSAILLVQSILQLMRMSPDDPNMQPAPTLNVLKDKGIQGACIVIALCVAFVALFSVLGYVIVGAVVSAIIMVLIGKRNWVQIVVVSILVPLVMWVIFYKVLTVNIPLGPLNFIRNLMDMI